MSELLLARRRSTKLYVDDVFQTFLRTGNGTSQRAIGPDMTAGGLVITKSRSSATGWRWCDTRRGIGKSLDSSSTAAQLTEAGGVTSFDADGVTFGNDPDYNASGVAFVDYLFRNAPKFSTHDTFTHVTGTPTTIDLSTLGEVGYVHVKRTDGASDWPSWHRSLAAGHNLRLNTTAAQSTTAAYISVTGTTLTFAASAPSGQYAFHALAHDDSEDGIIQCGSFTCSAYTPLDVDLGFEVQFVTHKLMGAGTSHWTMQDVMRGMSLGGDGRLLFANGSSSEGVNPIAEYGIVPTASGFRVGSNFAGATVTYIYLAIRRPNKPPTSGTEVYNAIARTGTGAAAKVTGVGFAPDFVWPQYRNLAGGGFFFTRLLGAGAYLTPNNTGAQAAAPGALTTFDQNGFSMGADAINVSPYTLVDTFFRRAPGFFDEVCYTGTGVARTVPHGLGVAPELMIVKRRSGSGGSWLVYSKQLGASKYLLLQTTLAQDTGITAWNDTDPGAAQFTVGSAGSVIGETYVACLFASLPGISKVGSYTGNGTSQTIPCGFTTGARFILIKRTDAAGDWYVWDSARGIVAANDPHLSLNTTAAEVTTDDSVDPHASGFIVNQVAVTNINVSGGQYIFLAIA